MCEVTERLTGTIRVISKFVPGYGIVQLDEPFNKHIFATINMDTQGRRELIERLGGELKIGAAVTVESFKVYSEAIVITQIK